MQWYNHQDSYPTHWASYIIAELRILFLLYSTAEFIALVQALHPIDDSIPPTAEQLNAFRPFASPKPDRHWGQVLWLDLLKSVRQSVMAVLTVGWYEEWGRSEEYNYVIDMTGEGGGSFAMHWGGDQSIHWQGVEDLPADAVQRLIEAERKWKRKRDGEEEEEKAEAKDSEAALAKKEEANQLYRQKQSTSSPHTTPHGLCPLAVFILAFTDVSPLCVSADTPQL